MPNTRDIRRRIKSVKNTQQITRALQTVSASKMSRAQLAASRGREYSALLKPRARVRCANVSPRTVMRCSPPGP